MTSIASPLSSSLVDTLHAAREAMVVSQLQPNGIITETVLNAYRAIARENFVPRDRGSVCYLDETLDLGNGKYLLEPMIHGLLVEHAQIQANDSILVVGDMTGYSAALLRELSSHVTDAATLNDIPLNQKFNVILFNGAVAAIPSNIVDMLNVDGRLTCVMRPNPKLVGRITVFSKNNANIMVERPVKDANAPYIKGCEPKAEFLF